MEVLFLKFFKFGVVGFSGMFIDFFFTWLCKEKLKINKFVANSTGFALAATSNYFLNRIWTFRSQNPEIGIEYSLFILISLVGLGLNNLIIYILNKKFKMNFYLAKIFATGVVTIWNFLANYSITFRQLAQ
ncbi:MAG: GtrA family protein [Dysgonamonadaceae bacterium]|jgi:putative flippase GtrA|nr:GtrA family protein [Dysgonamonadaceae bacterium]